MTAAQTTLPFLEILLRLLAALLCGAVIGLNREFHRKPAGFRTFALVSLGAALVVISMENRGGPDSISRVIQGLMTGIGFLGAGVIFRREAPNKVSGLTTAAAIWLTAGLGCAAGLGHYKLVLASTAIALVLLLFGGPFERLILGGRKGKAKNEPDSGNDTDEAP
jgi:putative Mg2+ transporter-C (MgtC) family protein